MAIVSELRPGAPEHRGPEAGSPRALRPKSGLFVNSMKELYITSVPQLRGLETLMRQMEQEGIWKWNLRLVDENEWPGLYQACRRLEETPIAQKDAT